MRAVPKPPKSTSVVAPKLEEHDYIEIGEKIGEALEFGTEVEITIFFEKKHESFSGVITSADPQTNVLKVHMGGENTININIMSIVGIK